MLAGPLPPRVSPVLCGRFEKVRDGPRDVLLAGPLAVVLMV